MYHLSAHTLYPTTSSVEETARLATPRPESAGMRNSLVHAAPWDSNAGNYSNIGRRTLSSTKLFPVLH